MTPEQLQQNAHEALLQARMRLQECLDYGYAYDHVLHGFQRGVEQAREALYAPKTPTNEETFPEGLPF